MTATVDPVIVVYALRYALPRASGALGDVLAVVKQNWPALRYYQPTILREIAAEYDAMQSETTGWSTLRRPEREAVESFLRWRSTVTSPDDDIPSPASEEAR